MHIDLIRYGIQDPHILIYGRNVIQLGSDHIMGAKITGLIHTQIVGIKFIPINALYKERLTRKFASEQRFNGTGTYTAVVQQICKITAAGKPLINLCAAA